MAEEAPPSLSSEKDKGETTRPRKPQKYLIRKTCVALLCCFFLRCEARVERETTGKIGRASWSGKTGGAVGGCAFVSVRVCVCLCVRMKLASIQPLW
mmetsp:Transcript_13884/g.27726  ORF Transcript_13884/g.27726 Transcript_13884/m.27726 type:complete len:97 (+) Transcript_13884:120-410(+)